MSLNGQAHLDARYIYRYIQKYIMGKLLTIQPDDDRRLEFLKVNLGLPSKVEVLRQALDTLEKHLERHRRIKKWQKSARLVSINSSKVNKEFQAHSLLKKL